MATPSDTRRNVKVKFKPAAQRRFDRLAREFQRQQDLRSRAVEAARGIVSGLGREEQLLDKQIARQQQLVRAQAARGLAAGLAQAGTGVGGGATLAAGRQAGLEAGLAGAQLEASGEEARRQLRRQVAQAKLQVVQAEEEAGSLEQDRQLKRADYEAQVQAIFAANKGTFDDDEDEAAKAIRRIARNEPDPVLRRELLTRASNVQSGAEDF